MTFNLIDLALGLILVVSVLFSKGLNFIKECVKFFGVILTTFISLHYYIQLGDILKKYSIIPESLSYLLAFALLASVIVFLFILVAEGWTHVLNFELPAKIEKIGSWIVSMLRVYLVFGLIYVGILISGDVEAVEARRSASGVLVGLVSVSIYQAFYDKLIKWVLPKEELRTDVIDFILGIEDPDKT